MPTNLDAKNVSTGKPNVAGAIYYGALTETLPTDAVASIGSGFKSLGYVSEDGVVNSNSPTSENIKAWGGDTIYSFQTEKEDTFQFTLVETLRSDVLKFIYGSTNVTEASSTAPLTIKANATEPESHSIIIDMILQGNTPKRICIPNAKLSEIGDITYSDGEAIGYEVTITCMPDTNGNTHYEYIGKKTGA